MIINGFGENHRTSVYGPSPWQAGCTGPACAVSALFLEAPGRPNARRIVPDPHPLDEEMA